MRRALVDGALQVVREGEHPRDLGEAPDGLGPRVRRAQTEAVRQAAVARKAEGLARDAEAAAEARIDEAQRNERERTEAARQAEEASVALQQKNREATENCSAHCMSAECGNAPRMACVANRCRDATFWLAVQKTEEGASRGSVAADVGAIVCGSSCASELPAGALVVLTATPQDPWSAFVGWSATAAGPASAR